MGGWVSVMAKFMLLAGRLCVSELHAGRRHVVSYVLFNYFNS